MAVTLYNTFSGKKEKFKPIREGKVGVYTCGPTVYDHVHIGNLRTMVFYDFIRRMFELNDFALTHVMNITDVDDKTIRRSRQENMSLETLTNTYEKLFFEDTQALNILKPHKVLSARAHMAEIITLISVLLEKGSVYKTHDGIYFDIKTAKNYGALAKLQLDKPTQERIENDEYDKENPRDFAVWKFYKEEDGEAVWAAPFGRGRPGWHIECSAMAMHELGETIDVHAGGTDLIFPHHTNELAQSESATGKPFVNYWMHGGMMNIENGKMAKSKGTFLKLKDLTENKIAPLSFRYWLLTAHYRTQVNFTWEAVSAAQTALIKLYNHFATLGEIAAEIDAVYKDRFLSCINDDLDIPRALALTWELIKDKKISDPVKKATLIEFDKVFGLGLTTFKPDNDQESIPLEVIALADAREEARKEKDFAKADAIRLEIQSRGYEIKDTPDGLSITKF